MAQSEKLRSVPVDAIREEFRKRLKICSVMIVRSETGSGKTTRLTQTALLALDDMEKTTGKVVCTQPTRITATTAAGFVRSFRQLAGSADPENDNEVAYDIGRDHQSSAITRIA